jgi:hypothetical protein
VITGQLQLVTLCLLTPTTKPLLVIESPQLAKHFTREMDRNVARSRTGDHRSNAPQAGSTNKKMRERSPAQGNKHQHWYKKIKLVWL